MAFEVSRTDQVVRVIGAGVDTVDVQELYDFSVDWLAQPQNLDIDNFVEASGKALIAAGPPAELTGITLIMLNDWRLQFQDEPGPDTVSKIVRGGNLVAINTFDNNPIKPSTFTQVQVAQSVSPTLIQTNTTSGLTAAEAQQLEEIVALFGLLQGGPVTLTDIAGATPGLHEFTTSYGAVTITVTPNPDGSITLERT